MSALAGSAGDRRVGHWLASPARPLQGWEVTHVLWPGILLVRRMYEPEVIGAALAAKAAGLARAGVARRLGLARSTVRGWLDRLSERAERIRAHFTRWAYWLDPSLSAIAACGSLFADALAATAAAAGAAARRLGVGSVWAFASAATAGLLLANTSAPFPDPW
jgi:lambda repressor-like predicted transcriptional regulator